jgi:hypothetical protein
MSTTNGEGSAGPARLLTRPFVVVTTTAFIFFIYIGMLVPIVPLFIEGPLGRGEFGIGLTIAAFAGAAILARPFLGRIADRHGRRVLLVGGSLLAGLAGIASGQVTEFWQLLISRSVMGVGEAAVFVGAATLIADLSPRDRRAEGASSVGSASDRSSVNGCSTTYSSSVPSRWPDRSRCSPRSSLCSLRPASRRWMRGKRRSHRQRRRRDDGGSSTRPR